MQVAIGSGPERRASECFRAVTAFLEKDVIPVAGTEC